MNPRHENRKSDWFSDDEFWETTYPLMFPEKRFAGSPRETDDILALIGRSSGNVLDLACGPARISALLAQRGFAVTGVDRSPFLLARAKERVASLGVSLELVHSDMRDFHRPDSFDIALSLFTSFGFFRDDEENQRVLNNVFTNLRAGGVFVLDAMGKEMLARIFNPTGSKTSPAACSSSGAARSTPGAAWTTSGSSFETASNARSASSTGSTRDGKSRRC